MKETIKVLIIDDDVNEALLLAKFLTLNNVKTFITTTNYQDALKAIQHHFPDAIIISMCRADEDVVGLTIATFIRDTYLIPLLLLVEYHEEEVLDKYIAILPYSCLVKSNNNNHEQVLNSLHFAIPILLPDSCKYKAFHWKVTQLAIDEKGEPVSKKGMKNYYEIKNISLSDILYFKAGNSHVRNSTLIRLKSDSKYYYAIKETIGYCLTILPPQLFIQVHDGYIISIDKITGHNAWVELIIEDHKIPIGISYVSVVKEIIGSS